MSGGGTSEDLARLSIAERALARAETMPEVLAIKAQAEAARLYAKRARLSLEQTNHACRVRLDAEAKAAELLDQMREQGRLLKSGEVGKGRPKVLLPAKADLSDLKIEPTEAHKWSRVARSTADQREAYARDATVAREEVTRTGLAQWLARLYPPDAAVTPALPEGRYRCIVIDPPWPMEKVERDARPDQGVALDYPTLPVFGGEPNEDGQPQDIEHVAAVPALAAEDGCHVYLWTTQHFLHDALHLFDAWGVNYECTLTWAKPTGPCPFSWRYTTEPILFGRVGSLPLQRQGLSLWFAAPSGPGRHSRKPDVFYERVLEASPEPRLELFARTPRDGFVVWGNEVAGEE